MSIRGLDARDGISESENAFVAMTWVYSMMAELHRENSNNYGISNSDR